MRLAVPPQASHQISGNPRHWKARRDGSPAVQTQSPYTIRPNPSRRQGVSGIYRSVALAARRPNSRSVRGRRRRHWACSGGAVKFSCKGAELWPKSRGQTQCSGPRTGFISNIIATWPHSEDSVQHAGSARISISAAVRIGPGNTATGSPSALGGQSDRHASATTRIPRASSGIGRMPR